MPIAMPCPTCKAKLKGPDQLVGRTLKCPGCGTLVTITADALVPTAPPAPIKTTAPPSPPKTPKEPPPEKKPAEPPSLFDMPDNIGFLDDPAPAVPPAPVAPVKKKPAALPPPPPKAPAPPAAKKPAAGGFPNMELDDDAGLQDEPVPSTPPPPKTKPAQSALPNLELGEPEDEPFTDFEMADDEEDVPDAAVAEDDEIAVDAVDEEEEVWVDPVEDEGGEDELAVVEDDELLDVVAANEDDLDVVEAAGPDVSYRLLQMPRMYVRSQAGLFAMTNAYDLLNAKSKKKVGEAIERPETSQQLLSMFVSKNITATKIEVIEGRNKLMMSVRRAPYFMTARAEIFDADDEKLGSFDILPFSAITGKPLWISDPDDKKIIKLEMKLFSGRRYFKNKKGVLLAEWVHELTYEKKMIKFKLAARGNSFYLIFKDLLDERPRDKMLILGASLGLDLLQAPTGQRGMRFGGT